MADKTSTIILQQQQGYQFDVQHAQGMPSHRVDLPAPLGQAAGPSPEHALGTAVGQCLSSSLLFALRKYKQEPGPLRTEVDVQEGRNSAGRQRILGLQVRLHLGVPAAALEHLDRALASFEEFCTVTQSVRQAIPVTLAVFDATGAPLK